MFVAMPIAVVTLVRIFNLPHMLEVCLVALAISPVPPAMPKKTIKVGGRHEYSLGLLAIMSLLSIVVVPLAVNLLGRYFGTPFLMAPAGIAKIVLMAAILPLIVGMIVKHVLPRVADRIEKPVATVAGAILSAAALVLIGGTWSTLWSLAASGRIIAIMTVVLVGLAIGHLREGPRPTIESCSRWQPPAAILESHSRWRQPTSRKKTSAAPSSCIWW
jgi:BASS family bile acid:Na+ symporter